VQTIITAFIEQYNSATADVAWMKSQKDEEMPLHIFALSYFAL
jgi:hypothetical protein